MGRDDRLEGPVRETAVPDGPRADRDLDVDPRRPGALPGRRDRRG
jgi:hypothetical protein